MSAVGPARSSGEAASIGKYRPILELGRGGMATVHLCVLRGLGGFSKLQVVKRLRQELVEDPELRRMFLDEARIAALINHPNVVQTNEVGLAGRNIFIAMEYLEGQSFEHFIRVAARNDKPLQLRIVLPILIDTLRGLSFAHRLKDIAGRPLKVVHRDVSPHNIFVTYEGQAKVVDFGIAKAANSSQDTRTGVLKGKVAYMAPEQVNGGKNVDGRLDVFAVGAILWRALVGKRLWRGMNDVEILLKVSKGEIPSPADEKADLDPELVAICNKALAPNADDRYATADEMAAALDRYVQKMGQPATPKEIGTMLEELSQEHRKRVARAIEERMQDLDGATWADVDAVAGTTTGSLPSSSNSPNGPAHTLPSGVPEGARDHEAAVGTLVTPSSNTTGPAKRGRFGLMVFAVAAMAAVGLVFAFVNRAPTPAVAKTDTSASATVLSTPASSTTAPIDFRIAVTPPSASVFIDDSPLTAASRYARDGAMHKIRAEATGYEPEVQLVSFDAPVVSVTFDLLRVSSPTTYRAPLVRTAPAAHPAPSATVTAAPVSVATAPPLATRAPAKAAAPDANKTKLTIDNSNPW
jgi:serine/threonine-protein kinase